MIFIVDVVRRLSLSLSADVVHFDFSDCDHFCVRRYQLFFCGLLKCKGTVVFAQVMVLVVFSHG